MLNLHHVHLFASDIDATISFWASHFRGEVVHDLEFAGARNVFLRVGSGRIHLYDQPPREGKGVVHHLGIETDELEDQVVRLQTAGVSVSPLKTEVSGSYAMAEAPDGLLLELFQPDPVTCPQELRGFFESCP
ncbi:MAG: VOC family protein [Pseudomonadota bacterium]